MDGDPFFAGCVDDNGECVLANVFREMEAVKRLESVEEYLDDVDKRTLDILRGRAIEREQTGTKPELWCGPARTRRQRAIVAAARRNHRENKRTKTPSVAAGKTRNRAPAGRRSAHGRVKARAPDDPGESDEPPLTPRECARLRDLAARHRLARLPDLRLCPRCRCDLPLDAFTGGYCRPCKAAHEADRRATRAVAA